jgi:hypothetical protein
MRSGRCWCRVTQAFSSRLCRVRHPCLCSPCCSKQSCTWCFGLRDRSDQDRQSQPRRSGRLPSSTRQRGRIRETRCSWHPSHHWRGFRRPCTSSTRKEDRSSIQAGRHARLHLNLRRGLWPQRLRCPNRLPSAPRLLERASVWAGKHREARVVRSCSLEIKLQVHIGNAVPLRRAILYARPEVRGVCSRKALREAPRYDSVVGSPLPVEEVVRGMTCRSDRRHERQGEH